MSTAVQRRRGTTAQHASFAGLEGELTVDTSKDTLVVHDGATAGGRPLLREDQTNLPSSVTNGIYAPSANNVALATNGTRRLLVDSTGALTLDTGDATIYGVRVGRGAGAISTNTVVGASSLNSNTTGSQNTAIGNLALNTNTTGQYNTALGVAALNTNNGNNNTAVGRIALYFNSSGGNNVAVGHQALYNNSTGSNNVCIGLQAGNNLTTGSSNTILGSIAGTAELSDTVIIGAGATERLRIDSSGRLGVGTSAPSFTLDVIGTSRVSGSARFDGVINTLSADSVNTLALATTQGAGTSTQLIQGGYSASSVGGGTLSFRVYSNGNVQNTNNSYGAISDIKLKENIVDANSQWDDLKDLRVVNYNFKEGQTHTQIGLIAQEVELVSPGLVTESPDRDEEGNDLGTVTKSVNYSVLYMKAVKALQEAMERIETLEAKVAALEGV